MNYDRIYKQFIAKVEKLKRSRADNVQYERHHILPKCLGGDDSPSNLILLTLDEHFLAHKLLYKMHKSDPIISGKMISAINRMVKSRNGYRIPRHVYTHMRVEFSKNHPSKLVDVKDRIKLSLYNTRKAMGYIDVMCGCGCGAFIRQTTICPVVSEYIDDHNPGTLCKCGCNSTIYDSRRTRVKGHNKKYKCLCGCGLDTHKLFDFNAPNDSVFINGHDINKNRYAGNKLQQSLATMSPEQLHSRMKNSTMKADHAARTSAIIKGKSSTLKLVELNGDEILFYSFESDIMLNMNWAQVKYRIHAHNGVLPDGRRVEVVKKYTGGNKWKNKQ